ncbi:MAG: PAS domain S-box protein, partial [Pseudomonadales bacterium]
MNSPENAWSSWPRRYATALLVGAVALALRLAMNPWFGYEVPFITFFPAVAVTVWYAGVGPAALVTALGYLAGNLFIIAPLHSLHIANVPLLALHVVYFTSCALIIAFGALARRRGGLAERSARALQESARRHRFLVRLDDALRTQTDPQQIQGTAARLLGEHLAASQVAYLEFEPDQESFTVAGTYTDGVPALRGRHRLSQFGEENRQRLLQGEPFVAEDVEQHQPALGDLEPWRRARVRAVFSVPLRKAGRLVAAISISQATPRQWSAYELELVPRVVDRCWESSERARAEAALRASEEEFRTLFELSTMGVAEADANTGQFVRANERFCQITGRPLKQVLQSTFSDITHPEDRERDFAEVAPVLRGDVDRWESEKRYIRPDGSTVWVFVSGRLLRDRRGRPLRTIASVADISERKRAEQQLRDSERRFRVAQESSLMAFTLLRAVRDDAGAIDDFIWEYVNPAAERILEQPAESLLGRRMLQALPASRATSALFDAYVRVVETGTPHDMEIAGHADGVLQNICSKMDDGVAVWCMDITERKQMEAEVAASRRELRLVTDTAAVMLAHCDRDARFVFVNQRYAQRFARQPEELVGLHIGDIVGPQTYDAIEPYVQRALAGERVEFALPLEHPVQGLRYMQATYVPQVDAATGAVMGFVASLADITERRALEQQLREADQRKDEFLATLA